MTDKLSALRGLMTQRNMDAYIIPSGDSHASEYLPEYWRSRAWFSGFSGSAGIVVVTHHKAGLWTDGRYFIQAAKELEGSGIELFKMQEPGVPTYQAFLAENLLQGGGLGFDGRTLTYDDFTQIKKALKDKSVIYHTDEDLVGLLWEDRPAMPTAKAYAHPAPFAVVPSAEKLTKVREKMTKKKYTAYLVSALDDVAWLLNIRGRDFPGVPVTYAYVFITQEEAHIFIDPAKAADVAEILVSQGFILHHYTDLLEYIKTIKTGKLYYNPTNTNVSLVQSIPPGLGMGNPPKPSNDIIPLLKAVKTPEELVHIRNAFVKDGVVMVKALKWLDDEIKNGTSIESSASIKEGDVVEVLRKLRLEQPHYIQDSFDTISAFGENAAQAHYNSGAEGAPIDTGSFLIIDTGGQYMDGTTDTTRTIAIGEITPEMRRDFTLVLKGHIALARAVFMKGITGSGIDILARIPLWETGQNYNHGTGHGLGYCLSVHEGPHNIANRHTPVALKPGMLVTNEPGIYKEGRYGIRTENVLAVAYREKTDDGEFYEFENLTHCPIDLRAVDFDMLSDIEADWLKNYHARTYETLKPHLTEEESEWLKAATSQ